MLWRWCRIVNDGATFFLCVNGIDGVRLRAKNGGVFIPDPNTNQGSADHNDGEGHIKNKDRDEGERSNEPQGAVCNSASTDFEGGAQYDRSHCRLDAKKECRDPRSLSKSQIDPTQPNQDQ